MFKKLLSAAGIAAAIVLGTAAAASAASGYPAGVTLTASAATIAPGGSTTITATGLGDLQTVYFGVGGTGGSLSSIVLASGAGTSVAKPVSNGSASATFTASTAGEYVVSVSDGETVLDTVTITVAAAGAGTGGGGAGPQLPATGGTVPAAVIWAGVGAIGLGGIAVAAVAARRRAAAKN